VSSVDTSIVARDQAAAAVTPRISRTAAVRSSAHPPVPIAPHSRRRGWCMGRRWAGEPSPPRRPARPARLAYCGEIGARERTCRRPRARVGARDSARPSEWMGAIRPHQAVMGEHQTFSQRRAEPHGGNVEDRQRVRLAAVNATDRDAKVVGFDVTRNDRMVDPLEADAVDVLLGAECVCRARPWPADRRSRVLIC